MAGLDVLSVKREFDLDAAQTQALVGLTSRRFFLRRGLPGKVLIMRPGAADTDPAVGTISRSEGTGGPKIRIDM